MNTTTKTYKNLLGAERFWEKEQKSNTERNASAWRFLDMIPIKGRVCLDIGCGFGRDVAEIRRRGGLAYGIDVSPGLLARARHDYGPYFADADFFDLRELPFGLNGVDLIWSVAMFVHVPPEYIPAMLNQWNKWLNPQGHLVILSKYGTGQATYNNLGEDLPRDMYFHQPDIFIKALPTYRIIHQSKWQPTAVADEFFGIILEKT